MPFDPNVVRPESPPLNDAGDLELPDDLLELAAQLGDDARHLAEVYPCNETFVKPGAKVDGHVTLIHEKSLSVDGGDGAFGPMSSRQDEFTPEHASTIAAVDGQRCAVWPSRLPSTLAPGFTSDGVAITRRVSGFVKVLALASSVAAIVTIAILWYPRDNSREIAPRNIAIAPDQLAATDDTDTTVDPVRRSEVFVPAGVAVPPPGPPAPSSSETFLHEYSGPELEGLYDLIGDSEDETISI